jgi:arsenate reductase
MVQILHNPRCGKSRNCLALLSEKKEDITIIKYLENPLSEEDLIELLQKLNFKPMQLVRIKEKIWIDEYKNKPLTDQQIIMAMAKHPILIERPIVVKGDNAIVGRNLEEVVLYIS